MASETSLPWIIAGPVVRAFNAQELVIWLVTSREVEIHANVCSESTALFDGRCDHQPISIGKNAHVHLLRFTWPEALSHRQVLTYDLTLICQNSGSRQTLYEANPQLLYDNESALTICYKSDIDSLLHGSCRKPHYPSACGLAIASRRLASKPAAERPAMLIMSGDQVYVDDVAGPMLNAIRQVIDLLGLWGENIHGALIQNSDELFASRYFYYDREELLPHDAASQAVEKSLFLAARKPIFTSVSAHNHLITLSEMLAMYLLVWSDALWPLLDLATPQVLAPDKVPLYESEREAIEDFVAELGDTQRLLAHIPTYMIFDDHDVTDDWNLTRHWEETAYQHPFSRRIIGNALAAYFLCQGWGNDPKRMAETAEPVVRAYFDTHECSRHDEMIDNLLVLDAWHYELDTQPKVVVLDTRTRRWRSESKANKPSGLLDWEALSELQSDIIHHDAVILVSPAPIFGVKLIETVQAVFTFFGKALMVDAENWMAHKGTANVILNIFAHRKTPRNFVILSGDVHYSFVYDVWLRRGRRENHIWQITASGFKNTFPKRLLTWFDRMNRWLFAANSPLNWLTQRRRMKVKSWAIEGRDHQYLLSQSGMGYVEMDAAGEPIDIELWVGDDEKDTVQFLARSKKRQKKPSH